MRIGQKTLLFGPHQFILHPLFVLAGWIKLYGLPSWKELICIIIHDWGYWWCGDIEGEEGLRHPEYGADLALKWFGLWYWELCLFHSRSYAKMRGCMPSRLCWADKLGMVIMPTWMWWVSAGLTGEMKEYDIWDMESISNIKAYLIDQVRTETGKRKLSIWRQEG